MTAALATSTRPTPWDFQTQPPSSRPDIISLAGRSTIAPEAQELVKEWARLTNAEQLQAFDILMWSCRPQSGFEFSSQGCTMRRRTPGVESFLASFGVYDGDAKPVPVVNQVTELTAPQRAFLNLLANNPDVLPQGFGVRAVSFEEFKLRRGGSVGEGGFHADYASDGGISGHSGDGNGASLPAAPASGEEIGTDVTVISGDASWNVTLL